MQFREQGRKIQCIRCSYDHESERKHQKVVATLPKYLDSFPAPDFLANLSDEEKKEFDEWWLERQKCLIADIEKWRAKWAGSTLTSLAKAICGYPDMTAEETAAAWSGLIEVVKALKIRQSEIEHPQSPE
jgi:hypothetical protein